MNIVILAGGTGSIALQRGLYEMLDSRIDGIDTKIIVNAYDNGLSTGAVRQVMGGKILGPSDVRKNQTTRLELENPKSPWLIFLAQRFTCETSKAKELCHKHITQLEFEIGQQNPADMIKAGIEPRYTQPLLRQAVEEYFNVSVASRIDYTDFALANIIYAGLARMNGNSLRAAARIMAQLLNIKDNVILNDDTSLFLGAITQSGKRITDEGDIVSWGDESDPFVDIFFTNVRGLETTPILCDEAATAIADADLIILSSGTQWSSLIPTYASQGFKSAINRSQAKIIMVMNRSPDKDSPSQTASDIISILVPKYFEPGRLNVITDLHGHPQMVDVTNVELLESCTVHHLSNMHDQQKTKHEPKRLAHAIARTYFKEYLGSNHFIFDYDDTLVGRGNKWLRASNENVKLLSQVNNFKNISICTGNTIKAINLRGQTSSVHPETFEPIYKPLMIFADGGVNLYEYDTTPIMDEDAVRSKFVTCINPMALIPQDRAEYIIDELTDSGIPSAKIDNRGNALIAIKPIDAEYRKVVASLAGHIINDGYDYLEVRLAGRTTVEICCSTLSKATAIKHVIDTLNPQTITYVGDEFDANGNDAAIAELSEHDDHVKVLKVNTPSKTAFFLTTLLLR